LVQPHLMIKEDSFMKMLHNIIADLFCNAGNITQSTYAKHLILLQVENIQC